MYVCMYVCIFPYRGLDISEYVYGRILCVNYSSTSPILRGKGQIRLNCDLKDFNFIITLFSVSWRRTVLH